MFGETWQGALGSNPGFYVRVGLSYLQGLAKVKEEG
jgi:hypothetical protein